MENIVNAPHNRGALPRESTEPRITESMSEEPERDEIETPDFAETYEETDKPNEPEIYTHVRAPEIRRGGTRILMGLTAVCGAVSGAVIVFTGKADPAALEAVSRSLEGTVGELFLRALATGAVFLAAELILGFFALGDWLVWALPLCYAMGTSLRVAASGTAVLLPSAAAGICAVSLAAAASASFSQTLLRLSEGGSLYRESSPLRSYALAFFGYALMIAAAAVYEGIALNWK
ncbi:MAG: hypothetical protein NC299_13045 [Lachnospiraceae bacterium]|nr:hypothetical protein [Ruminococcus sp.]MCM1275597.1 hypothetical protein [Lachnospiraceae bacterium]MCM1276264.1 hypothetical protein [Lachnospiraceae bacterium]